MFIIWNKSNKARKKNTIKLNVIAKRWMEMNAEKIVNKWWISIPFTGSVIPLRLAVYSAVWEEIMGDGVLMQSLDKWWTYA